MNTLYKLTTQDNYTRKGQYNECLWGPKVTHSGTGEGELCGPGYVHAYTSPFLAVLLNPIHADIYKPKLWEAEGVIVKNDRNLKVGCLSLTIIKEVELPRISIEQRVIFSILCVKEAGYNEPYWLKWANGYLDNTDRSAQYAARAAEYAAQSAEYAARAAEYAAQSAWSAAQSTQSTQSAEYAAQYAARAAAQSTQSTQSAEYAAQYAARAAARSARAAESAAKSAARAAEYAAQSAEYAARSARVIDITTICIKMQGITQFAA